MINFFKKLNTYLCLSAVSAGIFCSGGSAAGVPKGVTVNGIDIGGKSFSSALSCVRSEIENDLKQKSLKVISAEREYVFTYPEISYKDNLQSLIKSAKRNQKCNLSVSYYLCGLDEVASGICHDERILRTEPYAQFNATGTPFTYHFGNDGREVDKIKLKSDILQSLKGGFEPITVKYHTVQRNLTLEDVKSRTVLLGSFSTQFDNSNVNRTNNIRLAAALINGVKVEGGATLSFNDSVGKRLPERGFLPAKIIENGEFVEGVGGGVCQVSTTLYNAALLSGMTVVEYHPHSLPVGYVAPSRDAMVSGTSCDLKFVNPSKYPVYIRSYVQGGTIKFNIYGKSNGASYSLESVVTGSVPPPEEACSDPALAREGREGILSEGYLLINRGGFVRRIKLRQDKYQPQKRIVYTELANQPSEQNSVNF